MCELQLLQDACGMKEVWWGMRKASPLPVHEREDVCEGRRGKGRATLQSLGGRAVVREKDESYIAFRHDRVIDRRLCPFCRLCF